MEDDLYKEQKLFWLRVKQLIKAHKLSQEKFADYISVQTRTFWGWIHNHRIPDAITACRMAEALGVTVEYLAMGEDDINARDRMTRTYNRKTAALEIKKLVEKINTEAERLRL